MRLARPTAVPLAIGLALVFVVVTAGAGVAAYKHDRSALHKLPSQTLIAGVDVSGLSRDAAIAKVRSVIDAKLDQPATLIVGDHEYSVTPRQLGVRDDAEAAVDTAFAKAHEGSWLSRSWHRVFGGEGKTTAEVTLSDPATRKLKRIVRMAAEDNAVAAVDASATVTSSGTLNFTSSKHGWALDKKAALHALQASLEDGRPHEVALRRTEPKVTEAAFNTAILVSTTSNKLYLYKNHQVAQTYSVATGMSSYPTPTGHFSVVLKRYMPTWVNPHPNDSWGASLPASIPPGPSNPLGLRALNLSAPGIRIHGTPSDYSIGHNASHGCIRMHNYDVVKLYPEVPTGTSVFITTIGTPSAPSSAPTDSSDVPDAEGG